MSSDWQKDVKNFHLVHGQYSQDRPEWIPSQDIVKSRHDFIEEEVVKELLLDLELLGTTEGRRAENLKEVQARIADGIVDSIYVLLGCAVEFGIDLQPIWNKVNEANMLKIGGGKASNGKVLKPEGWKHPDIAKLIEDQKLGLPEFCDLCGYLAVDTTGYHCGNSDYKKLTSNLRPKEIPRPTWCTLSERKLLEGEINGKT